MNEKLEFWKRKLSKYLQNQKEEYSFDNECTINSIRQRIKVIEEDLKSES